MPVATIIAGIISAGAGIAGGVLNAKAQREANATNAGIDAQTRRDNLRQNAVTNKQNAESLALSKNQQEFSQNEAKLDRRERLSKLTREQLQHAADNFTQILNENNVLTQNRMAPLIAGGK
jgi:hypothetical protein